MDRNRHRKASLKSRATSRLLSKFQLFGEEELGRTGGLGGNLGEEVWAGVVEH